MERLIETLSTFFEKRIRSPFWIYFLMVRIYHLRKEIYVTLFVDEAILYDETGCSLASYLSDPFSGQDYLFVGILVLKTVAVWISGFVVSSIFAWEINFLIVGTYG